MSLTHLERLEAEAVHILRETVPAAVNPVMLYSTGKDSSAMLRLAMKAFYPAKPPFPMMHVDTTWKFREMYSFRDRMVKELGLRLIVHVDEEGLKRGINPFTHGSAVHNDVMKSEDLQQDAVAGQSVTLTLEDEIDIFRGDVIAKADAPAPVADQFEATVISMGDEPMLGGRPCLLWIGSKTVTATPAAPKYRVDVNSFEHLAARKLEMNEIGVCNFALDQQIAFEPYRENREIGGFILIDRLSNNTVAAGMLHFALRRADNIQAQAVYVGPSEGPEAVHQLVHWPFRRGSNIANLLDRKLHAMGRYTYLIEGDNIRHGLNRDLGFTAADRVENVRRTAEVARLMVDAGLVALVSLISPFRSERRMARDLVEPGEFFEVSVDPPLNWRRSAILRAFTRRRGELKDFTGIDSPYERPEAPELRVDSAAASPEESATRILEALAAKGIVGSR